MNTQSNSKHFIFLGDSLINRKSIVTIDPCYDLPAIGETVTVLRHQTAGFYKILMEMLQLTYPSNHIDFNNFARGGATVHDIQMQLDAYLKTKTHTEVANPDKTIFICIGTNDASHEIFKLGKSIAVDDFQKQYQVILEKLSDITEKIYCILPPPVSVLEHSDQINAKITAYNQSILELGSIFNHITFIDLFSHFEQIDEAFLAQSKQLQLRIEDGVHLSDLGNQLAANIIWDSLIPEEYP